MILIVGLGNPGQSYQKTRHNLGWLVLDSLQKKWKENYFFSNWEELKKFKAKISKGTIEDKTVILAKPLTFMNLSGQAVKSLNFYYKIKPNNLIVVQDDIDISFGKIKIVKNRGPAGHKGVKSIISELGRKNFIRLRIGIKPSNKSIKADSHMALEKFVLKKFNKKEEEIMKEIIDKAAAALETMIKNDLERTMNEFNQ